MDFAGINYLAVVVAAAAGMLVGMGWYSALTAQWLDAIGKRKEDMHPSPLHFVIAAVSKLVMAWVLAGLIGHLGTGQVTVWNGIVSGAFAWLGFVITSMAINQTFQEQKRKLLLVDGGYWLAVLVVMGGIIGAFGV